LYISAGTGEAA